MCDHKVLRTDLVMQTAGAEPSSWLRRPRSAARRHARRPRTRQPLRHGVDPSQVGPACKRDDQAVTKPGGDGPGACAAAASPCPGDSHDSSQATLRRGARHDVLRAGRGRALGPGREADNQRALSARRHRGHPAWPVWLHRHRQERQLRRHRAAAGRRGLHGAADHDLLRRVGRHPLPDGQRRPGDHPDRWAVRAHHQPGLAGAVARLGAGRLRHQSAQADDQARARRHHPAGLHAGRGHEDRRRRQELRRDGIARPARIERAADGSPEPVLDAGEPSQGCHGVAGREPACGQLRAQRG